MSGVTGGEAACIMLEDAGVTGVKVVEWDRRYSDRYDPLRKVVALSKTVYRGRSISSVAVAVHETGHAVQHFKKHKAILRRITALRATELLPALSFICLFASALIFKIPPFKMAAMLIGCTWGAVMIANLITLPVEWDASERALDFARKHRIVAPGSERADFEAVLNGANWAGVGMFSKSFSYVLYNLLPFMGRKNYKSEKKAKAIRAKSGSQN